MNYTLINATDKEEIRVAVIKNKRLRNLNIETSFNQKTKGNIYKGKISKIEQSIEAIFVNYGKEKQGFLPFKEITASLLDTKHKGEKPNICDILKEGQDIVVQIEKEGRNHKGATLSTYINLTGTYMILTPNNAKIKGISRQINITDKQYLKNIIKKIALPSDSGLIIRTAGTGKSLKELQWEADYLLKLWDAINIIASKKEAPFLIYKESDIIVRTLRDYLRKNTDAVYIDEQATFEQAKEFVDFALPHYLDKIKFFKPEQQSLFDSMGIEKQVNNAFSREISLKSGATIVFDTTEALTSVDINSARATKGINIKETAYNTNLEAAREIAIQLQLRDIGGLIVIDFIDMANEESKKSIEKELEKATKIDKARIQINAISQFGLLEMSRQRIFSSIVESVEQTCSQCNGRGTTPTIPTLALTIIRKLESDYASQQSGNLIVQSSVELITYLLNEKRKNIVALEQKYKIKITLLPNSYMQFPSFTIDKQKGKKRQNFKSYQDIKKQNSFTKNSFNNAAEEPIINADILKAIIPKKPTSVFKSIKSIFR